jgi:hypothetical protein
MAQSGELTVPDDRLALHIRLVRGIRLHVATRHRRLRIFLDDTGHRLCRRYRLMWSHLEDFHNFAVELDAFLVYNHREITSVIVLVYLGPSCLTAYTPTLIPSTLLNSHPDTVIQ